MNPEKWIDQLVDLIAPKLVQRGFVQKAGPPDAAAAASTSVLASSAYDHATCQQFLNGHHLGDSVLARARVFFGQIAEKGEINSVELVAALDLKGPTSIPANLTNPLKKSARRLKIDEPWTWAETPDGTRTIWKDRDGIAARMVEVIEEERKNRELVWSHSA
ncbi:MAG TPA: hypothetical protein VH042_09745 [Solirubrobacterales bacterium]|nr:hypothetical protein [Solirubrobacterales bacterium]